jgi:hypothetical protein
MKIDGIDLLKNKRCLFSKISELNDSHEFRLNLNLTNELHKSPFEEIYSENSNKYGLISFSKNANSILMSAHYSENHTGFFIEINSNLFFKSPDFPPNEIFEEVKYKDKLIEINDDMIHFYANGNSSVFDKAFKEMCITKSSEWISENEYRVIIRIDPKKEPYMDIDPKCVNSIILGCNMKNEEVDRFKEAIQNSDFNKTPVYRAIPDKSSFSFARKQILN